MNTIKVTYYDGPDVVIEDSVKRDKHDYIKGYIQNELDLEETNGIDEGGNESSHDALLFAIVNAQLRMEAVCAYAVKFNDITRKEADEYLESCYKIFSKRVGDSCDRIEAKYRIDHPMPPVLPVSENEPF